jgi:protein SCO1/2
MPSDRAHPAGSVHALFRACCALVALVAFVTAPAARAQLLDKELPRQIRGLDVVEHLGALVPLDLKFTSAQGKTVPLGTYFNQGKPVILVLAYYTCPTVCTVVMDKLAECLDHLDYTVGKDFNIAVVSIDPTNTTKMAADKKDLYLTAYGHEADKAAVAAGWEFHTATLENSRRLAEAVGWQYRFLPESGQYSHPVAIMVLTPDGRVARYIYGLEYPPRDVKLALLEAAGGKIASASLGDRFLMFCFHYDPSRGTYSLAAMRVMRVAGVLMALGVGSLVALLKLSERSKAKRRGAAPANGIDHPHNAPGPHATLTGPTT